MASMPHGRLVAAAIVACLLLGPAAFGQVYRWTDADGVIHLSSSKPPPGVQAERIELPGSKERSSTPSSSARSSNSASSRSGSGSATPPASAAQVAEREELLGRLRTRECVIALEALDRLTSGSRPTSATELRRLQQTADLNCSKDPARRHEQEEMAAKLRVAGSPACVEARNRLAAMLEPGAKVDRDQLKAQQDFVAGHCTAPVR
jgi:hypothetical protein